MAVCWERRRWEGEWGQMPQGLLCQEQSSCFILDRMLSRERGKIFFKDPSEAISNSCLLRVVHH